MKILPIIALTLFMPGCANAQTVSAYEKFDIVGVPLPAIHHMTDMKITGDTLWFVYESKNGHGQRFLRRALIDIESRKLTVSSDIGANANGYMPYMPYPAVAMDGGMGVVSQDDGEIYRMVDDISLDRKKQYLLSGKVPAEYVLSQYVQDVFMDAEEDYIYIVREAYGGRQLAVRENMNDKTIDIIRHIAVSPASDSWIPNAGELAVDRESRNMAFAYTYYPVIDISDTDGKSVKSVRVGDDTFDVRTLEDADIHSLNPIQFADITSDRNGIYALRWNCRFSDVGKNAPIFYVVDWNGNILNEIQLSGAMRKVAVYDAGTVIGWDGNEFVEIKL